MGSRSGLVQQATLGRLDGAGAESRESRRKSATRQPLPPLQGPSRVLLLQSVHSDFPGLQEQLIRGPPRCPESRRRRAGNLHCGTCISTGPAMGEVRDLTK